MNTIKSKLAFLLFILLSACSESETKSTPVAKCELNAPPALEKESFKKEKVGYEDAANNVADESTIFNSNTPQINKKKIIKDGSLSLKTENINSSKSSIDSILKKYNSYYDNEEFQNNENETSIDLTIRIPVLNFEKVINEFENGNDKIISKSIQSRDVTEEFVDVETRLSSKKDFLKHYKELLSKAKSVKETIEIQESIRVLTEEIESKEGQLKYLSDQVEYSTLNVHLFKEKTFVHNPSSNNSFAIRCKDSILIGWYSIVDFVLSIISSWPIIIIIIGLLIFVKLYLKKRKKKQKS